MKTWYKNIGMMSMMFIAMMGFTSCDDAYYWIDNTDREVGYTISGHWFGDMDMYNAYTGERAEGSEIEFTSGWNTRHGRGIEIDYYYYARPVRNEFEWEVVDGYIYLTFLSDPDLDCVIGDYRLTNDYFSGYIDGCDGYSTKFSLRNYDRYWNTYGYTHYSTRSAEDNDSTQVVKGIRGCNRKDVEK